MASLRLLDIHYQGSPELHFRATSLSYFMYDLNAGLEDVLSKFADLTR